MRVEIWLMAFVAMALLDIAWVLYMRAANAHQPVRAAIWAGAIHAFGALAVLSYVDDARYLSATMCGTVLGTFVIVMQGRRKAAKEEAGHA